MVLALAVFGAGEQVLSAAHMLLVPHTVCLEHGELVHLDDKVGHASSQPGTTSVDQQSSQSRDLHAHCPALALRREHAALAQAATALVPPLRLHPVDVLCSAVAQPAVADLLLMAPKTSPPAHRA